MSEKLKIVYRPLQELSPYAHNARTHSPEQVAQLVESIKQFGGTNPVLIDEKGEIIAGHGRVSGGSQLAGLGGGEGRGGEWTCLGGGGSGWLYVGGWVGCGLWVWLCLIAGNKCYEARRLGGFVG